MLALKGAPVTVLPPIPASKPRKPMASSPMPPGPNRPWCPGGGGGGVAASCAFTAPPTARTASASATPLATISFLVSLFVSFILFMSPSPAPFEPAVYLSITVADRCSTPKPAESPAVCHLHSPRSPLEFGPTLPCPSPAVRGTRALAVREPRGQSLLHRARLSHRRREAPQNPSPLRNREAGFRPPFRLVRPNLLPTYPPNSARGPPVKLPRSADAQRGLRTSTGGEARNPAQATLQPLCQAPPIATELFGSRMQLAGAEIPPTARPPLAAALPRAPHSKQNPSAQNPTLRNRSAAARSCCRTRHAPAQLREPQSPLSPPGRVRPELPEIESSS